MQPRPHIKRPKLTIGMAHFEDFNGVYFTVMALRLYHAARLHEMELVVVDNSPGTAESEMMKNFVTGNGSNGWFNVHFEELSATTGTSASRNRIFDVATGDIVLVMDCHVMFENGAIDRLLEYYDEHPHTKDILSGPLVYDDLYHTTTHFDDHWRGEMWGTWGSAWRCPCGPDGLLFSNVNDQDVDVASPRNLVEQTPVTSCPACGKKVPQGVPWSNHEQAFVQADFLPVGADAEHPPFEIPGMGLGVFSCRREAWLGFNKDAAGFGGEEMYIHGKFRAAGHKAICLPFLRWTHRFGRPAGVKYPLTRWGKVRNYVLEFQEMGWDLTPVYEHFVNSPEKYLSQEDWDMLLTDPVGKVDGPGCNTCGGGDGRSAAAKKFEYIEDTEQAFAVVASTPRDLDQHCRALRTMAERCDHITEFSGRRESTVAILAGKPTVLVSHQLEQDGMIERLAELVAEETAFVRTTKTSQEVPEIEETDMLFIDGEHTFARLAEELTKYAPATKRYIVMHDTQIYGERGEDGGPGLMAAILEFVRAFPEWSIISHTVEQYGLTVLGRLAEDKPKLPSKLKMASNLAKAVTAHVASGLGKTPKDLYEARLMMCSLCSQRVDNRCSACGCFLDAKASMRSSECPLGLWPDEAPPEGELHILPPMLEPVDLSARPMPRLEMTIEDTEGGGARGTARLVQDEEGGDA